MNIPDCDCDKESMALSVSFCPTCGTKSRLFSEEEIRQKQEEVDKKCERVHTKWRGLKEQAAFWKRVYSKSKGFDCQCTGRSECRQCQGDGDGGY